MAEMTLQQALDYAIQLQRAGKAADAENIYQQILKADPRHGPTLQMLARLYYETGRHPQAAETLQRAIAVDPKNPDLLGNLGSVLAGLGKLDEAAEAVKKALAIRPNSPGTHGNLANILLAKGDVDGAIASYRHALALNPNAPETVSNLGNALRKKGDLPGAIDNFRRATELRPDFVEARINLAHALKESGKLDESIETYRQALAARPDHVEAIVSMGNALQEAKRFDESIEAYRRALAIGHDYAEAWYGLGGAFKQSGDIDQAIAAYRHAVHVRPDYADAYCNLGIVLNDKGLVNESIEAYQNAIKHLPTYADAYNNLGITLRYAGRLDEAVAALRHALSLRPNYPDALNNLGLAYDELGKPDEAIGAFRQALAMRPQFEYARNNLANTLKEIGSLGEAIAEYRIASETSQHPWLLGNLLFALHAHPDYGPEQIYTEHLKWNERFIKPLASLRKPHDNDPSPNRPLRFGLVSADLNQHPVGRFMLPLFQNINRDQYQLFCYSDGRREDWVAEALERLSTGWHRTVGLSDQHVADLIRQDRIDILFDLSMHTKESRLTIFGLKPAPVQATYLAYCSTTGVDTIDYRISDPWFDPPYPPGTEERIYTEKTLRLPNTYWCYQSPPEAAEVAPSPANRFGMISFGGLNTFSKVTPQAIAAWGKILVNTPGSRMVLHCKEGQHRHRTVDLFRRAGVEPHRVMFVPRVGGRDYFKLYDQIDIALDTFPYPGGTTTCDALWMGVPVITLKGQTAVSRGGYSILSNVGLTEFVADSIDQYINLATNLAKDLAELAELRTSLRPRMQSSPLMNAPAFARDFHSLLRQIWQQWCANPST